MIQVDVSMADSCNLPYMYMFRTPEQNDMPKPNLSHHHEEQELLSALAERVITLLWYIHTRKFSCTLQGEKGELEKNRCPMLHGSY